MRRWGFQSSVACYLQLLHFLFLCITNTFRLTQKCLKQMYGTRSGWTFISGTLQCSCLSPFVSSTLFSGCGPSEPCDKRCYPCNKCNIINLTYLFVGVTEGCQSMPVCVPDPCPDTHWCHDVWRAHACLLRLCTSKPCENGGTCYEGVDSTGVNKYRCVCTPEFQGAHCETGRAVVANSPDPTLQKGLIIGKNSLIV